LLKVDRQEVILRAKENTTILRHQDTYDSKFISLQFLFKV